MSRVNTFLTKNWLSFFKKSNTKIHKKPGTQHTYACMHTRMQNNQPKKKTKNRQTNKDIPYTQD